MTELAPVQAFDYPRLATFHAAFPGDTRGADFWQRRFRYWWDDNPAFDESCVRGWMIREDDGHVAGFLGSVPSRFQVRQREQRVFGATTWRVLPSYRSSSIQLYLALIEAQGSSWLLNTTANPTVERVLDYLKFRSLPSHQTGRAFLVALNTGAAMRAYLRERFGWMPDAAAGMPLALAQLPLRAALRGRRGGERTARVVERADGSFDDLWDRTRGRFATTSVRRAVEVQWMCFANDDFQKTLVGFWEGDALRGFAIFADALWRGVRVLELVDLWTEEPRDRIARALVGRVVEHAGGAGYAVVVLHDYREGDAAMFRRWGLLFTSSDVRKHYYRPPTSDETTLAPADAGLSGFDGDRFL